MIFPLLVKITGGSSIASVKVNDLEIRIYELEKQNTQLKEKVILFISLIII